ncbi:hypothetical protein, partial [Paenibacillus elgii]|uniref:hypothetical protein n=1 Tax=Paenibacillus elgii TaxID=189691 RepID=UPI00203BF4E5
SIHSTPYQVSLLHIIEGSYLKVCQNNEAVPAFRSTSFLHFFKELQNSIHSFLPVIWKTFIEKRLFHHKKSGFN